MQVDIVIWFFPIVFIFHDFEEIIVMQYWMKRNLDKILKRFPRIGVRIKEGMGSVHAASFSIGVYEEFIIISIVTIVSYFTDTYEIWIGLMGGFIIHLVVHIMQVILYRGYIPALVTSIISLPFSIWAFNKVAGKIGGDIYLYILLGTFFMIVNLAFIHRVILYFERKFET